MAKNITECLVQLQQMANQNVKLLTAINDSFYTKAEHLNVTVDGVKYNIPSFLSLENKINDLMVNFENLVNAPKTGVAAFNFNGNTQQIEVKSFQNSPDSVKLSPVINFGVEQKDILKDFLFPNTYVKMDLSSIGDDITSVSVKKIIPKTEELRDLLLSRLQLGDNACTSLPYTTIVEILEKYKEDEDYVEYDTIRSLPIRNHDYFGEYKIEEIISNETDTNFDEYYNVRISGDDNPLVYFTRSKTLMHYLEVGDKLISNNDKTKLEIVNIDQASRVVRVKVLDGAYLNLTTYNQNESLGLLKYYGGKKTSINEFKYINVPLEEDQYILLFIAPINNELNIRADYGDGLFFNTFNLYCDIDGKIYYFHDYFTEFVNNIGDMLFSLSAMSNESIANLTKEQYDRLSGSKPIFDESLLEVIEINSHLNNSPTIQEIYSLYNQKQGYKNDLKGIQSQIDQVNNLLSSLSFEDTTQNRSIYEAQLTSLNTRRDELNTTISSIINELSVAASDSDTPIDNPKYRIRGFFDCEKFISDNNLDATPIRIIVQYRYKNSNQSTGNAKVISNYVFSDWNLMDSVSRVKYPERNGQFYNYKWENENGDVNEISYNQIDIPISQGESVDIRLKVVYDLGYPFCVFTSAWSDVLNIPFPNALKKNVTVLDIIEENNNDITNNSFENILKNKGVTTHVDDKVMDQDNTYFHQPEHISSGFYTAERRIIPLRDKLNSIDQDIISLKDEVYGTTAEDLQVSIRDGISSTTILPYSPNLHETYAYQDATGIDGGTVKQVNLVLEFKNTGDHNVKLFSIFPGNISTKISNKSQTKFGVENYIGTTIIKKDKYSEESSVHILYDKEYIEGEYISPQTYNQWVYFRIKNAYTGEGYYATSGNESFDPRPINDVLSGTRDDKYTEIPSDTGTTQAVLYPKVSDLSKITIDGGALSYYKLIKPGETLQVPFVWKMYITAGDSIQKTISFDLRTSLYSDPINYILTIKSNESDTLEGKIQKQGRSSQYNPIVIE